MDPHIAKKQLSLSPYLFFFNNLCRVVPGGAGYDSSAAAFQMRNMQLNAAAASSQQRTMVTNIMLAAEQIRVDCVQLTTNGRYVVTGSIYGPPQVWDLKVAAAIANLFLCIGGGAVE